MENPISALGLAAYLAPYLYGRASGQTADRSQEVAARGVEYGPPVNLAGPYGQPDDSLPRPPAFADRPAQGTARPPVATPRTPQADSANSPADAAADTMRSLQAATSGDQPAREGRDANERLANFGFAMAASRNPSLFGMIGEAGLALQRGNREDRQDSRQEREVDVMSEYRQAQIRLAAAEQEWQRDPNNPLNVARLAEARYRVAAAANVGRSGGGSASEGQGVPIEREDGRFGIFYPRTGRIADAPEGVRPMGAASNTPDQRRMTDYANRRAAAAQAIVTNPLFSTPEAAQRALQNWETLNPPPGGRTNTGTGTGTGGTSGGNAPTRLQYRPPS